MTLPKRTANTMSDAIALSSPSGRMSKRARKAAEARLDLALFGPGGLSSLKGTPPQPDERTRLLRTAKELRDLAGRGMSVRKYTRAADRLEAEAAAIPQPDSKRQPTQGDGSK